MDEHDIWGDLLINDATIPLIHLTSDESTDLNDNGPNESSSSTHLPPHNSHEEISFQNNWLSSFTIDINQEPPSTKENQSQNMHLNASIQQQDFDAQSSSNPLNLSANSSRKRKLLNFSSQTSAIGCSSHVNVSTNPVMLNQFNSQLGFNVIPENVENSQRSVRIKQSPPTSAPPPIQWASISNIVHPNMSMPVNRPMEEAPLVQNVPPFPVNATSNSRTGVYLSRSDATSNSIANMSSNIQAGTGNETSIYPPAHYRLIPQGTVTRGPAGFIMHSGSIQGQSGNNASSTTEQSLGFSNAVDSSDALAQRVAILRRMQQELVRNPSVSRASRNGRSRILSESMLSFDRAGFHRRVVDMHDRYRGMRLDVDNMSYEELLELEERIGKVNVGLGEEKISKYLKQRKYPSLMEEILHEVEPCCICREEYKQEEIVGKLDCGHDFHSNCIKKWLMIKNLCPICRTAGLVTKITC